MSDLFNTLVALQPTGASVKGNPIERLPGISPGMKNGGPAGRTTTFGGAVQQLVNPPGLSAVVAAVQNRTANLSAVVGGTVIQSASLDGVVDTFTLRNRAASLNANVRLPTTLLPGLLAYWKLDGTSADSLGVANGTDTAITYSGANGKINSGAGFNGSTSKIDCGSSIPLTSSAWTMAVWVKAVSVTSFRRWFAYSGDGPTFWSTGGAFWIVHSGVQDFNCNITITTSGAWQHLVVTRATTTIRAYLNGTQTAQNLSFAVTFAKTSNTWLGNSPTNSEPYSGALDEAGIWNRALSASEVTDLYQAGLGLQYPF